MHTQAENQQTQHLQPSADDAADVLALARDLLSRPSVTPHDGGCLDVLQQRLQALGFHCEDFSRGGVRNLYARRGTSAPLVAFAGHVDVVPTGDEQAWTSPPFHPTVRDGFLYARGAVDMKSSLAAALTAVERLLAKNPHVGGSLAFVLTADEEGEATDGTLAVVDALAARGEQIDFCVVGEPSAHRVLGDTMKNGRRGSLSLKLTVFGEQCHIAYPELGLNPIHALAPALAALTARLWDKGNEYFPPTSFQVSNIHAGTGAGNVIPASVTVDANFRFSPMNTVESLQRELTAVLDAHGLRYQARWTVYGLPFLTGAGRLTGVVQEAVREVLGEDCVLSTSGGTSDGRFLARISRELVELGPVNATIHKVDECIAVADLPRLRDLYQAVFSRLLT